MASYSRTRRIGEEIKKVVSRLLLEDLKDPRISSLVSITDVNVTSDLKYAYIYISALTGDKDETLKGLKSASGFVRKEIGKQVKLRYTPEIIFRLDDSIEKGVYMSNLIKDVNTKKEDDINE